MTNYDILKEYEEHGEPLPSYEDWKAVNELEKITLKDRAKVANQLVELQKENRKLKDLLRGCKPYVRCVSIKACEMEKDARKFLTAKIDEVLK